MEAYLRMLNFIPARPIKRFVISVVGGVCVYYTVTGYMMDFTICIGPSMTPTFPSDGSIAIINKWKTKLEDRKFEEGDVVVCRTGRLSKKHRKMKKFVCKRIAAVEGQVVQSRISFFSLPMTSKIGKGKAFLCGDNLNNSYDSRRYGPVQIDSIRGLVTHKIAMTKPHITTISNEKLYAVPLDDHSLAILNKRRPKELIIEDELENYLIIRELFNKWRGWLVRTFPVGFEIEDIVVYDWILKQEIIIRSKWLENKWLDELEAYINSEESTDE
jgi:hypothetical protein